MNIAVIGTGGVGGYFGGKLARFLSDTDERGRVFFIARNRHLEEIQKNGLSLHTTDGECICRPAMATDDISELPLLDICLICVKGYDLDNVCRQLKPKIEEHTLVLPLLNGVDIYERIRGVISSGRVFPSCVYVGTHIEKPGHIVQSGGTCTIHLGGDPQKPGGEGSLLELFRDSGIKYSWYENPYPEIWSKFIFISAYGLVTAAADASIGEVLQSETLSRRVKDIMAEIYQIAKANSIELPEGIVEDSFAKGNNFPFETKTSFQRDYADIEKMDERDLFGGAVIRMGKETGIRTDTTEMIYAELVERKPLV